MVATILPANPHVPDPANRSKVNFSEDCHVAYQIKGNHECSNMETNILLADTPPPKVNLGALPGIYIFALFDVFLARQHILISEFLCK